MRLGVAVALVACALGSASPALADSHSVSYSDWTIAGDLTTLKFVLPGVEARRLTGVDVPLTTAKKLGEYLLAHVAVEGDGENCAPIDQGYDIGLVDPLAVSADSFGFEVFFRCPTANPRVRTLKNSVLFERVPAHVNYARVRAGSGEWASQFFTSGRQEIRVPSAAPPAAASWLRYVSLGFGHVLHSLDRLAVVLGLVLLARGRREQLELLAAGLGGGYVLALLVTAGSWVAPRTSLLEGFVGFMALWIAAELVARETSRAKVAAALALGSLVLAGIMLFASGWAAALVLLGCALIAGGLLPMSGAWLERRELWVASAAILGFLDGFVLPSEVAPAQPPKGALLAMSAGFDVGAFLGAAFAVALVLGALFALRYRKVALPRPLLTDFAAAVLGGLGAFWIVARLYG
jgi:hypothetical protein